MRLVRLAKTTFFRKFEDICYIVNEISQNDLVLDECGSVFLSEIGREPKSIQCLAKSISSRFIDANRNEVERDFFDFVSQLEKDGFLITGQTVRELHEKEPPFSYSDTQSTNTSESPNEGHSPSYDVLKKHFCKHPRLFNMQIELTSFCNLKCIHCYLGDDHVTGGQPTEQILDLLDQLKSMGTLEVTFTGGEVFSRSDLPEILRHARRNDFSITILTNNILLTDSLLEEIKNTGVRVVQISVYSMDPEIHDSITRQSGSWKTTVENINKLVTANVPVQIGCPVMKQNLASFTEVIEWGRKMRFRVKPDVNLMARIDFSTDNLDHRLSLDESKEAIRKIISSDVEYQERLALSAQRTKTRNHNDPICGVGTSTLCMAANGDFYPCPGFQMKLGNLNTNSVKDVWNNSSQIIALRGVKTSSYPNCLKCPSLEYCHICMAKFYNESQGNIYTLSEHFCGVSHLNREIAENYLENG